MADIVSVVPTGGRARDLDETRRLLYGALVASETKRWELVGTLANALLHHGPGVDVEPPALLDLLIRLVDDGTGFDFAWEQIMRLTDLLDGAAG